MKVEVKNKPWKHFILDDIFSKEDYQILNELNLQLFNKKLFNKFGDIRNEAVNKIANFSGYENLPKKISLKSNKIINEFFDEELNINKVDYYFTNSISRSSIFKKIY